MYVSRAAVLVAGAAILLAAGSHAAVAHIPESANWNYTSFDDALRELELQLDEQDRVVLIQIIAHNHSAWPAWNASGFKHWLQLLPQRAWNHSHFPAEISDRLTSLNQRLSKLLASPGSKHSAGWVKPNPTAAAGGHGRLLQASPLPSWAASAATTGYYGPNGWVPPQAATAGGSAGAPGGTSGGSGGISKGAVVGLSVAGAVVGLVSLFTAGVLVRRYMRIQAASASSAGIERESTRRSDSGRARVAPLAQPLYGRVSQEAEAGPVEAHEMNPLVGSAAEEEEDEDDSQQAKSGDHYLRARSGSGGGVNGASRERKGSRSSRGASGSS